MYISLESQTTTSFLSPGLFMFSSITVTIMSARPRILIFEFAKNSSEDSLKE